MSPGASARPGHRGDHRRVSRVRGGRHTRSRPAPRVSCRSAQSRRARAARRRARRAADRRAARAATARFRCRQFADRSAWRSSVRGRTVVHTTHAGTQGLVHATGADEVLTGSFVNVSAIARYIRRHASRSASRSCAWATRRASAAPRMISAPRSLGRLLAASAAHRRPKPCATRCATRRRRASSSTRPARGHRERLRLLHRSRPLRLRAAAAHAAPTAGCELERLDVSREHE